MADQSESLFDTLLRFYFAIAGVALGLYAVDGFSDFGRTNSLLHYLAFAANWFCARLTPDKLIEFVWGWRLDTSTHFWNAYHKIGFYVFAPLIRGSFELWADRILPADPAWRGSIRGQSCRVFLLLGYALLFGLFLTVVVGAWPFFLCVVLLYLPMHTYPFDPHRAAKRAIYTDTAKAALLVVVSVGVAMLLSLIAVHLNPVFAR
jgi:hypothetical protein